MAIRNRVVWGDRNPFSDPRMKNVAKQVADIMARRWKSNGTVGGSTFNNSGNVLPSKGANYYREYDLGPAPTGQDRGKLRLVIGNRCEVYVTGDHYDNFRQVIQMPGTSPPVCPGCGMGFVGFVSGKCESAGGARACSFKLK